MNRLLGMAVLTCAVGCSAQATEPALIVVEARPGEDLEVEPDALIFRALGNEAVLAAEPGDVLVSGQGTGFLREVVSVRADGEAIHVATRAATLAAAVDDLELARRVPARVGKDDSLGLAGLAIDLGGTEIDLGDRASVRITGGELRFAPELDLDMTVRRRRLEHFRIAASGQLDASIDLEAHVTGEIDKYVFRKLASQQQVFVQFVGAVPVVEVVEISVGIGLEVRAAGTATVAVSGRTSGTVGAGAELVAGEWQSLAEQSLAFGHDAELLAADGELELGALIFAQVEVRFYDLAGPALKIAPYVSLTRPTGAPWYPRAGVKGFFEGVVKIPIVDKGWTPVRRELFDFGQDFAPLSGDAPDPPPPPPPPDDHCGSIDAVGLCTAGLAITCEAGEVTVRDCAALGGGCSLAGGAAACVSGCGDLDWYGGCVDGSLRWCDGGAVYVIECAADGPGCGWQDDTIGYNCL